MFINFHYNSCTGKKIIRVKDAELRRLSTYTIRVHFSHFGAKLGNPRGKIGCLGKICIFCTVSHVLDAKMQHMNDYWIGL